MGGSFVGGMTDKAVGVMLIVGAICWHVYYTVWILVTPWLETSQDLAHWLKYFPDRYYGLALPALVLVVIVASATTFVGVVLQSAGSVHAKKSSKERVHSSASQPHGARAARTLHFQSLSTNTATVPPSTTLSARVGDAGSGEGVATMGRREIVHRRLRST